MEVIIPYNPRTWAKKLHESDKRWKVIVAHRRAGKTVATLNHIQRDALLNQDSRFAYIAPTYKQAKNIAWDIIKHYSRPIPGTIFNEAELRVDYPNGSRITLYGADNPDSLRGLGLWGVVFDEYSQQPSNIFSEIIRPALADHSGYGIWIGTPKGKNDFHKLYENAKKDEKSLALLLAADDTGVLSKEELEDAKGQMTEDEFNQEFYCSFTAAIQGAYYAKELEKMREDGRIRTLKYQYTSPVHTWWDIGVSDSTAIIFMQHIDTEWHMIDYYENSGEGLNHYINVLQEKRYTYGEHWVPHDAASRSAQTGKSYVDMARELGYKLDVVPRTDIQGGINAARMSFGNLWIDPEKCEQFINAISLYRKEWDDKRGEFKQKPFHDWTSHAADALRYWAITNDRKSGQEGKSFIPHWQGYGKVKSVL